MVGVDETGSSWCVLDFMASAHVADWHSGTMVRIQVDVRAFKMVMFADRPGIGSREDTIVMSFIFPELSPLS